MQNSFRASGMKTVTVGQADKSCKFELKIKSNRFARITMEVEHNKSELFVRSHIFRSDLELRLEQKPTDVLNLTSYLTYTLVFIVFLRYYSKKLSEKKGGLKNGNKSEKENGSVLGLDAIDGPKPFLPLKLVGNMPYFLPYSETLTKAVNWGKEYPHLCKMTGINQTFVGLNSAPLIQQLFKSTDFGHGVKSPIVYDTMKPFITNGVLVSTGKNWQSQRKILMKSQSFRSLKAYMGMLNKHSKAFVGDLQYLFQDGKPHEINETININFLRVICEMLTGMTVHSSKEFDKYHHNFQIWKESLVKRLLHPWLIPKPLWKFHPLSTTLDKAIQEMFEFAKRRITEHRERVLVAEKLQKLRQNSGNAVDEEDDPDKPPFRSVLDELIDAGVADDQIIEEVNTMLFGGHETGASTIHCFCFAMALHPEIQEMCRKEVDELFDDPSCFTNGEITFDAVQTSLKCVERCILETLRLFPPVFIFFRKLQTPLKLEHDNKTYVLPVGTNVTVVPYVIHRKEEYFPDPEKFEPDRFLPEEISKRPAYSFLPFSGGSRNCLGLKFAMVEMKVMAAYLLRNFVMTTTDKMEDIPMLPFITLTPAKDYTFQFVKRNI